MLGKVLTELNNFFVRSCERITGNITGQTISGVSGTYLPGQYILIKDTILNDGVYRISTAEPGILTVETTLSDEVSDIRLFGLAVPKEIQDLATEIQTFITAGNSKDGVASESLGDYSVSYGDKGGGWQAVFSKRLNAYRSIYPDFRRW